MVEKTLIFDDKKEFIQNLLKSKREILSSNLDRLPKEELPFMEPHLRVIYFESYFLLANGFYNASLVLLGILLENLAKEKLFIEGFSDKDLEDMNFGQTIKRCEDMAILEIGELTFLKNEKINLRNPYSHYNKIKLSKGVYFKTWKINNPVDKLKALDEQVKKGEITEAQARQKLVEGIEPTLLSSKELRPLAHIAKNKLEEDGFAISKFLEIDKFTRNFAEKYFKPKNEKPE